MAETKGRRSAGSEKLAKLFHPRVITTRIALAKHLRVTEQAICAWVLGNSKPQLKHMIALQDSYGIHPADWLRKPRAKRKKPERAEEEGAV